MKILTALTILFMTAGCMSVGISRAEKPATGAAKTEDVELNSFAWGFVPVRLPPESEICPKSRIETVRLGQNGTDVFLSLVTLGVYVPQRAEISCALALNSSH
jgi:hypothetical protein